MNNFIEKMAPLYKAVPSALLVSVRLAQSIIESGWGQSDLAVNALNFAGIKYSEQWKGDYYTKTTKEEINGKLVDVPGVKFRKYATVEEFVKDHSNFITSTPWREKFYADVINATTYQGQCAALTKTYATDSSYGATLINTIERYDLTKYDKEETNLYKYPNRKTIDLFSKYVGYFGKTLGVMYHNDAGSPTGLGYEGWVRNFRANSESNAALGFANEYISDGEILQVQRPGYPAWAAANPYYNNNFFHIEICQQLSVNDEKFKANEEYAFMRGAEVCHQYGITPNKTTIKLHTQVSLKGTECPKRSAQLHGGYDKVQEYFIARTKYYMSLGKTMKEMIDKLNGGAKVASDSRYIELRPYSSNAKAFDKLEVGQKVTIRKGQTFWYDPQSGKGIKPSGDFTGDTDIIERVMNVEVGYSRRAYLLKGKNSWILEQDLVEARKSWESVKVDDNVQPTIPKDKDYAFIDGKYYDVSLRN